MGTSDFELLATWQSGDERAGNELVRRHFPAVHRFFLLKLGPLGEDLVQETFLACADRRDRLPDTGSFKAYLFGIARRKLFLYFRRERGLAGRQVGEQTLEQLGTTMGTAIELRDEQRILLEALRRLPVDYQITLELRYWEHMTLAEIAEVLDAPVGTIKARLTRGREQIREQLLSQDIDPRLSESIRAGFEEWTRDIGHQLNRAPAPEGDD